ncbi:ATP-binding protein [uncultured Lamprocystis sp.]|jgi:two-component system sensor histidine kinase PilS (NtrC family)|uniref:sensor histidine kinase n=1 Tax=uncultured Lamprocystis sp. TaxID=543132 RepID=UPI0025F9F1EA|nr:ATP-binding protein [uncultured Lamprocystis sp.]
MASDKSPDSGTPSVGTELPDARPVAKMPARFPTWESLRWLFLFRLLIVVGLVLVFSPAVDDPLIARVDTALAWRILVVYAVLVLASGLILYARWPSRENQVYLAIFIDLVVFTLVMHAGGGVGSGLGVLLAVAVAAAALLMEGRFALLYAAFATVAVMTEQTYVLLRGEAPYAEFTQAGLLGVVFFALALLAHVLYRRVRAMEELVARRKVDIDDLSKLNAFIIQDMGIGVMVVDGERRVRLMNQSARDLTNVAGDHPGTTLKAMCPELDVWLAERVRPTAPQGGIIRVGDRDIKPTRQLLGDYRAAGVLLYLRDQQELVKEAQQIKLASLGTLTASIAHNIRNPLSAISHAGQLLAETRGLSPDDRHLLDIIRRNSGRIDEIIRSVLQLSRRNQVELQLTELVAWLETFCDEFRESHGLPETRFLLEFESPPISVEVDPRHLHQIIANLCENALLHGGQPDQPAQILVRVGRGQAAGRALVEVTDDGPGIDEASARDIFNPFFTTKASGTGLGLYIARELAETNGIRLQYERRHPRGSCFRLVFA